MSAGVIVFAHGSRDPAWAETIESIRTCIRSRVPDGRVHLAYLEFMQPSLDACVEELWMAGAREILLFPAFIAAGAHLRAELPELVASVERRFEGLKIRLLPAMGDLAEVQQAAADFVSAQLPDRRASR